MTEPDVQLSLHPALPKITFRPEKDFSVCHQTSVSPTNRELPHFTGYDIEPPFLRVIPTLAECDFPGVLPHVTGFPNPRLRRRRRQS